MTITHGQSLIVDNLLHFINYPSGLNALFYNCGMKIIIIAGYQNQRKINQHKITTNIGKRNLSGAQ